MMDPLYKLQTKAKEWSSPVLDSPTGQAYSKEIEALLPELEKMIADAERKGRVAVYPELATALEREAMLRDMLTAAIALADMNEIPAKVTVERWKAAHAQTPAGQPMAERA